MSDQGQNHPNGEGQFRAGLIGFGIDEDEGASGRDRGQPEAVSAAPQAAAEVPAAAEPVDPVVEGASERNVESPSAELPAVPLAAMPLEASAEDLAAESRLAERMAAEFPLDTPADESAPVETTAVAAPVRDDAVAAPVVAADHGKAARGAAAVESIPAAFDLRAHLDEKTEVQPEAVPHSRAGARVGHYGLYAASFALAAALGWFGSSYLLPGGFQAPDRAEVQETAAAQPTALSARPRAGEANVPVQEQTATVGARKDDGPSFADEIRSLKDSVEALRASLEALKGSAETLKADAARAERDAAARLGQIAERLERVERADRDPAAKLAPLTERLERVERQMAAVVTAPAVQPASPAPQVAALAPQPVAPVPQPAAPAPVVEPAKPAIVEGWVLREVYDGIAVIEGRNGGIREVTLGQTVPGVGRVEAIQRRGKEWIVITSRGIIPMERW